MKWNGLSSDERKVEARYEIRSSDDDVEADPRAETTISDNADTEIASSLYQACEGRCDRFLLLRCEGKLVEVPNESTFDVIVERQSSSRGGVWVGRADQGRRN